MGLDDAGLAFARLNDAFIDLALDIGVSPVIKGADLSNDSLARRAGRVIGFIEHRFQIGLALETGNVVAGPDSR